MDRAGTGLMLEQDEENYENVYRCNRWPAVGSFFDGCKGRRYCWYCRRQQRLFNPRDSCKAAGLVETLQGDGPFTVFAPTNAAFAKLPKATLEALLKDKKALTAILTYHVVSGKVMAADVVKLKDGTKVKTVNGAEVKIGTKKGVKVNDSNVVKTYIEASNGVIHVIDTVLIPKTKK